MDRKIGILTLRELIGVGLLVGLLLLGLFFSWYLGRQNGALSQQMSDCAWLALSGQMDKARKQADAAAQTWRAQWALGAALGEHSPMEDIDELFAQLKIYGAAGEQADFAQTCAALSQRLEAMKNAHALHLWSVF